MKAYFNLFIAILLAHFSTNAQENWTIYNSSNSGLPFNSISDIEFDSYGNKWVASWFNSGGAGIAKFDDNIWTFYNTSNGQGTSDIFKITYSTGELQSWVSVFATTTINFADGTQAIINSDHDYETNVLTIEIPVNAQSFAVEYYIEDSSETVEMSFYNANTNVVVQEAFLSDQMTYNYQYTFYNNISTDLVTDISIDSSDNKWIGTWQDGLIKFDDNDWVHYTVENSDLPDNKINCVANDSSGNVWVGTSSGLTKYNGTVWTNYNTMNSELPDNSIISIVVDASNNVWISTAQALTKLSGNSWEVYTNENLLNTFGGANSLTVDQDGKKWISSNYGVISFNGTEWSAYDYFDTGTCLLDCQNIAIDVDNDNNVWVGAQQECNNGGLLNLSDCIGYLSSETPLPGNSVMAINVDDAGNKWIGTFEGLAKLSGSVLDVTELKENKTCLYPNPVINILNIQVTTESLGSEYKITDINGRTVLQGQIGEELTSLDVSNFTEGVYLIKISEGLRSDFIKFIK